MNKFQKLFSRIHNFCIYSIFGFLASLINIACYWILRHLWHWQYLIANTLAWLVANIFGFFTNKSIVFKSKYTNIHAFIREFINFFTLRSLSFFIDTGLMFIGISLFHYPSMLVKIIDQIIVGIVNYYFSRFNFVWCNRFIMRAKNNFHLPIDEINDKD